MGLAIGTAEVVLEHAPPLGRIRCAAEAVLEYLYVETRDFIRISIEKGHHLSAFGHADPLIQPFCNGQSHCTVRLCLGTVDTQSLAQWLGQCL